MIKLLNAAILYCVFLLLAFPLFYFVYKFGDVEPMAHDFFQYYWLYKDLDISRVIAPHNMRLAGAFIAHLFYKCNFFYDTVSTYDKYQAWGFLKQVYFNALLFNYLSVAGTCCLIYQLLQKRFHSALLSFNGSLIYLLGFGTLFYELMPGTDSFSIFLFTLALYFYIDNKRIIILPLIILVFQREYILIVFASLALMDMIKYRHKYFLLVFLISVICFVGYYVLRKTYFYTPHLDYQASPAFFISALFQSGFPMGLYLKQLTMTLNLFFIYLGFLLYKKRLKLAIDGFYCLKIMILFLQVNIISYLAGHGTNCGRYFYMITPLIIYLIVKEAQPLVFTNSNRKDFSDTQEI